MVFLVHKSFFCCSAGFRKHLDWIILKFLYSSIDICLLIWICAFGCNCAGMWIKNSLSSVHLTEACRFCGRIDWYLELSMIPASLNRSSWKEAWVWCKLSGFGIMFLLEECPKFLPWCPHTITPFSFVCCLCTVVAQQDKAWGYRSKCQQFKPQLLQDASAEPLSKILNAVCSRGAISRLCSDPRFLTSWDMWRQNFTVL